MERLATPLAALGYEERPLRLAHLAHWLEDRYIRQLTTETRGPLRAEQPEALHSYLEELGASEELLAAARTGDADIRVCAWLTSLALHYEYGDKREAYEQAAATAVAATSSASLLAADEPELMAMAAAMGITPSSTAIDTLQSVIKAARQRPRTAPAPAAPPPKRPASASAATGSSLSGSASGSASGSGSMRRPANAERVPLAGLDPEVFPLGFATGSADMDAVARVLRMLHVRELRRSARSAFEKGTRCALRVCPCFTAH